jgi:hypothetical protein
LVPLVKNKPIYERKPTPTSQRVVRRCLKFGEKEIRNVSQKIYFMGNKCLVDFKQVRLTEKSLEKLLFFKSLVVFIRITLYECMSSQTNFTVTAKIFLR